MYLGQVSFDFRLFVNTDTCQEQWMQSKLISKTKLPPSSNVILMLKHTELKFVDEFCMVT